MKKQFLALILAAVLFVSLFFACSSGDSSSAATAPVESSQQTPVSTDTTIFTDSVGREVELPAVITKVSPSGSLAQMFLLAIAPDLIVTISSDYSEERLEYIPQNVSSLPQVGQFFGSADLNLESVAAIAPEVVIDIGEPKKTIVEDMDSITESTAIPAIHITATLESTPEAFRTLGKLLGREPEGEALAVYCERVLSQTADIMEKVSGNKISALYCLGNNGLNVLAAGTFHTETFDCIANNLAVMDEPSSRGSGNETDMEQLLLWNPEVIIFDPDSIYDSIGTDPVWQQLQAVQNGKYYEIPGIPYNWMASPPSINRYLGMLWLITLLYPEHTDFDIYDETAEYYKLFYHYDLSREKFDELTVNSLP